jgi:hypothetical protein
MKKSFLSPKRNVCFFSSLFVSFLVIAYGVATSVVLSANETIFAFAMAGLAGATLFKLDQIFFQFVISSLSNLIEWARYRRARARKNRGLIPVYKKRRGVSF